MNKSSTSDIGKDRRLDEVTLVRRRSSSDQTLGTLILALQQTVNKRREQGRPPSHLLDEPEDLVELDVVNLRTLLGAGVERVADNAL